MILPIVFSLFLASAPPHAGTNPDNAMCGEAFSIFLPDDQGTPAPNIKLVQFQVRSPDDRCVRNIKDSEIMRLHKAVKPIAAASFSKSHARYGVMIRYTLTPGNPAKLDMKTNGPATEKTQLRSFYNEVAALKNFHSISGTVYVLFHYEIFPSKSHPSGNRD